MGLTDQPLAWGNKSSISCHQSLQWAKSLSPLHIPTPSGSFAGGQGNKTEFTRQEEKKVTKKKKIIRKGPWGILGKDTRADEGQTCI